MCSQRIYLLKLLRDQGLPRQHLGTVFDALVLSILRYAIPAWSGFLSVELKSQVNSFLKRAFQYGFCSRLYTVKAIAEDANIDLFSLLCPIDPYRTSRPVSTINRVTVISFVQAVYYWLYLHCYNYVCMYVCPKMYIRRALSKQVTVAPRSQTNRNVFSASLNRSVDKSAERREDGRLFQILAPATAKLRVLFAFLVLVNHFASHIVWLILNPRGLEGQEKGGRNNGNKSMIKISSRRIDAFDQWYLRLRIQYICHVATDPNHRSLLSTRRDRYDYLATSLEADTSQDHSRALRAAINRLPGSQQTGAAD